MNPIDPPSPLRLSLVEVLILFLLVGLLGSLVVPLRQQAVEAAGLVKCRGNLYELGAALHLYAAENGGRLVGSYDPNTGVPARMEGTYIGDGRMYGALVTPDVGGYGDYDYLGRVHPLICPTLSPEVYASHPEYKRPEEIHSGNKIIRTGYVWMFRPFATPPALRRIANDTVYSDPHAAVLFDFGWARMLGSVLLTVPSHSGVLNVPHVGGHVTTFPIDEANHYSSMDTLLNAMRENSSSLNQPQP